MNHLNFNMLLAQTGDDELGYCYDAPIHYVVLNRKDNTWDTPRVDRYIALLDEIESHKGPGVMVTLGTGRKHFSSGFDLPYWAESCDNMINCLERFQELMARLLEFSMPTMCVYTGNAMAGGYIFGLCHDFRIMNNDVGTICLSELKLGLSIFLPFMKVISSKLPSSVVT